jgi:hypothetical protein
MDQSFRTPSEVTGELGIPVLAAVPHHVTANSGMVYGEDFVGGNGNGNGFGRTHEEEPVRLS